MKKILFVASECVPFVKTGGLADVVGSLPKALPKEEYDIRVMLPNYRCIKPEYREHTETVYYFQMDNRIYVGVQKLELDGITYYFIDNEQYFSGMVPYYDMFQDLERFAYHCHDWQASLVPVYLNTVFQGDPFFQGIRTVMTIHNLRFQGTWNVGHIRWVSGLPDECFQPGKLVSPYQDTSIPQQEWNCSMLRGGLVYSDYITTVSNTYSWEIQTPNFGDGLDDILKWRHERLWGIINGLDYKVWDPATDDKIYVNYSVKDFRSLRKANKKALQEELKLPVDDSALMLGLVSRLTDQKGLDLIDGIMDQLCGMHVQLVVLGTGASNYENMFRYYAWKYPGIVSANITYSDALSRKIYAAADAFLVPSAFEPCGLTQLISLRYGAIPIVHETGGLKDTVKPYNPMENTGTGFSFAGYSCDDLLGRIKHALFVYNSEREHWDQMVERGMLEDWSWNNSSKIYMDLYSRM